MNVNPNRRDEVDELIDESFPASDPPSWTATGSGSPHGFDTAPDLSDASCTANCAPPAENPRREDQMLSLAIQKLERMLDSGTPGQESKWLQDAINEFQSVAECLRVHSSAAEAPEGTYAEVDQTRPSLVRHIERLQEEHRQFYEDAQSLVQRASEAPGDTSKELEIRYVQIREQAESLLVSLRRHKVQEEDIMLQSFNLEFGAGD